MVEVGVDTFEGPSEDLGWGQIFGGQVLGQALAAAGRTVAPDRLAHSLYGSFLRTGDVRAPVRYAVERLRDGGSFSSRRVLAFQGSEPIFAMTTSFHRPEEGFEHQDDAPAAVPADQVPTELERLRHLSHRLPPALVDRLGAPRAFDLRPVHADDPVSPAPRAPDRQVWLRTSDPVSDGPRLHQQLLAYASDFHVLSTALQPHGIGWLTPKMHIASLDHAIWFHRPLRVDAWLLHAMHAPSAAGGRGLVRGALFDPVGRLVATTTQEGLLRRRE